MENINLFTLNIHFLDHNADEVVQSSALHFQNASSSEQFDYINTIFLNITSTGHVSAL